jgi:dienelactone hydrolase
MSLLRRARIRIALALATLAGLLAWSTHTGAPDLPQGVTEDDLTLELAGRSVSAALYRPARDDNAPLVVVVHGFARSRRHMAGWGAHLAGEGYLVIVPTQPAWTDHELNGRVLAELVERFRGDRRVALIGFSMGGLTTLLATDHARVDAWIGLDPVDAGDRGKPAAARLKAAAALILAEPEPWNRHGNAHTIAAAIPGERLVWPVKGGTHLDAEWPTDLLGQLACGFVSEQGQREFRTKTTEFLRLAFKPDFAAR